MQSPDAYRDWRARAAAAHTIRRLATTFPGAFVFAALSILPAARSAAPDLFPLASPLPATSP